jgi:hypothetical protein
MNLPYLYNASVGIFHNKMKYLEKGTGNTQHLVKRFGYDTKQAMHAHRILSLLQWYADGGSYEKALIHSDDSPRRKHLLSIKEGKMTLEEIKGVLEGLLKETEERYKERYMAADADTEMEKKIRTGVKEFILGRIEKK